jgi:hypothetical protein
LGTHAGLRHWDGDQELLARNEYLTAEDPILKAQLNGRLKLSDADTVAKPDTILAWYRKLVAHKFDGSKARRGPGRPRVMRKVEHLIVRLAEENRDWVMIGLPGHWPIWDIVYVIRRSAMSCATTVCHRRRNASARPAGRRSFAPNWRSARQGEP